MDGQGPFFVLPSPRRHVKIEKHSSAEAGVCMFPMDGTGAMVLIGFECSDIQQDEVHQHLVGACRQHLRSEIIVDERCPVCGDGLIVKVGEPMELKQSDRQSYKPITGDQMPSRAELERMPAQQFKEIAHTFRKLAGDSRLTEAAIRKIFDA